MARTLTRNFINDTRQSRWGWCGDWTEESGVVALVNETKKDLQSQENEVAPSICGRSCVRLLSPSINSNIIIGCRMLHNVRLFRPASRRGRQ